MKYSRSFRTVCFFMILSLAPALSALAQSPRLPRMLGTFAPVVGKWGEYVVKDKTADQELKMRMAIVGKEGDAFWYEVRNEEAGSVNIIKMLVTGNPNESSENIRRMIFKSGDSPAMEMNRDLVVMGRQMATHMFEKRSGVEADEEPSLSVEEIGPREVTVPAGTFKTVQFRIKDASGAEMGTHDLAEGVGVFGVVQSDNPSATMTLVGHGTDAVTSITEEPVPMTTPPGMPQGMPRGMPPGMGGGQ